MVNEREGCACAIHVRQGPAGAPTVQGLLARARGAAATAGAQSLGRPMPGRPPPAAAAERSGSRMQGGMGGWLVQADCQAGLRRVAGARAEYGAHPPPATHARAPAASQRANQPAP